MRPVARYFFPLPFLRDGEPPGAALSRPVRQRILRRRAIDLETNELIQALNELAGRVASHEPAAESVMQEASVHHLRRVAQEAEAPRELLQLEEAARALLGAGPAYSRRPRGHSVRSYDRSLLSIPAVGGKPVPLMAVLPSEARSSRGHSSFIGE